MEDWRTVTVLRSGCFTDERRVRYSLQQLLATECASPAFIVPATAAVAILCGLLLNVVGGLVVGIVCLGVDVALRRQRTGDLLAQKLSNTGIWTGSMLDRLTAAEVEWLHASEGQQLGQIRINPALMTVSILRERICRSCGLIALPHDTPDRYDLFAKVGNERIRMAPAYAVGVYAEPSGDIVLELCLRVAPRKHWTDAAVADKGGQESPATKAQPVPAADKVSDADTANVPPVDRKYPTNSSEDPRSIADSLEPELCVHTPQANEKLRDETRSPDGSTPNPTSTTEAPSPAKTDEDAGDAILTPNIHAMDAAGVAKLRSMLAAAATPSPAASLKSDASTTTPSPMSPPRSPESRGGLSATEIHKMRGMLLKALESPSSA